MFAGVAGRATPMSLPLTEWLNSTHHQSSPLPHWINRASPHFDSTPLKIFSPEGRVWMAGSHQCSYRHLPQAISGRTVTSSLAVHCSRKSYMTCPMNDHNVSTDRCFSSVDMKACGQSQGGTQLQLYCSNLIFNLGPPLSASPWYRSPGTRVLDAARGSFP